MSRAAEIRPLGSFEQYSSSRHSLGFYRCVAITCSYSRPSSHQTESRTLQSAFRGALRDVALLLPSLNVCIKDEETKTPKYIQANSMRISNHFEWRQLPSRGQDQDKSALLRILEDQHDKLFPEIQERPPWRIVCVEFTQPSNSRESFGSPVIHIVFAVHHSLADGTSAALFHSHLLDALNKQVSSTTPSRQQEQDIISLSDPPTISPPLEELITFKISWSYFLKALWAEFAPSWLRGPQPPPPWTGMPITLEPSRVNIRMIEIPSTTLGQVLAACRTQETTLTPLLHAIVISSLAQHIPKQQAQGFVATTPISLRPFLNLSDQHKSDMAKLIGSYVTGQEHRFEEATLNSLRTRRDDVKKTEEDIWTVARSVKADIQTRLALIPRDDIVGMLSWVSDWHARWLKMVGRPRDITWEVSNLGSMAGTSTEDSNEGEWKITQSVFTQSAIVAGAGFSVNVCSVKEMSLSITLCWQESIVETALMEAVAEDLHSWLRRISNSRG